MPKKQNKGKRSLSDQKNRRRPLAAPKKNPFETRKLKKKHIVVGQRLKSQESIGQARTQALEQRKKTLLVEYEQRDKVNAFIDKRIGEQDESLSHEEKMLIRYQKEKQKKLLKKSLFSLEDAEEGGLTHLGQSLSELDSFDDIVNSDDEEEMDSEIVSDYHFGGGIFQKVDTDKQHKNRDQIMKEVVAKSKYFKNLHQREREESIALTEELDDDLDSLLPHLAGYRKTKEFPEQGDDFDILTKELASEARAKPLNRLPTEEEIAQKQRDRLALLEKERQKRMRGDVSEEEEEEEESEKEEEDEIGFGDSGDDDLMSDEEEEIPKKKKKNKKQPVKPLTEREISLIEKSLKEDSIPFLINVPATSSQMKKLFNNKNSLDMKIILARVLASNNANLGGSYKDELQRMFELTLEYFEWLINTNGGNNENNEQIEKLDVISQSLFSMLPKITPTAVSHIKEKLIQMHLSLDKSLQINAISQAEKSNDNKIIWKASEFFLFKLLANLFPVTDFQHPIITPALLLMNRYIVYVPIYSISHIITKLFLSSMIYHYVKPTNRFVPELLSFLQLVLLSFLGQKKHSLFTSSTRKMCSILTLKVGSKREKKLVSQYQMSPINLCKLLTSEEKANTDSQKFQVLFTCVTLIGQLASLYENYPCFIEMFTPFSNLLSAITSKAIPEQVSDLVTATTLQIDEKIRKDLNERRPLVYKELKPVPIPSLAPKFVENYVPGRDYDKNQERARIRALKKQVKSEKKGAMRELRKDSIFIENERMKQRIADDNERKEKYKQIMHQLETEQHHYNVSKKTGGK